MPTPTQSILGWPRGGWAVLGTWASAVLLLQASTFLAYGTDDEAFGRVARLGARSGFCAFVLAFGAGPAHRFWPNAVTRWLLAHRPYLGVSFAFSHFTFLAANVTRVFLHYDGQFTDLRPVIAWAGGGFLYAVIGAMAITSFPGPANALGASRWRMLHVFGSYAILIGFLNSFGTRAVTRPEYLPFAVPAVALLALRIAAAVSRSRQSARAANRT